LHLQYNGYAGIHKVNNRLSFVNAMHSEYLSYQSLPGSSPLLIDFSDRFHKVQQFYSPIPTTTKEMATRAKHVTSVERFPMGKLLPALKAYNESLGCSPAVLKNIARLESSDCVTAVSGQQVALFGGPSYTIYKAATAIRLASQMRSKGIEAVPVFWLASNAADFEEIRCSHFTNSEGNLLNVCYPNEPESPFQMAGTVPLQDIGDCLEKISCHTQSLPFSAPIMEKLSKAYSKTRTFREAFAVWLSETFKDHGLIVFDPLMEGYQDHLSDFFERTIINRPSLNADLLARNATLEEASYTPQVWVDETESLLFLVDGPKRYKLQYINGSFRAKGRKELSFSESELLDVARKHPEQLSTNVLLRPILQDYLFPTACYIGGPAEVAYFAQLNAISHYWDLETIILPRAGFTIVNKHQQRYLERHKLEPVDMLQKTQAAIAEIILRKSKTGVVLEELDRVKTNLSSELHLLEKQIKQSDATVASLLKNSQGKIFYQLDKVRNRFVKNYRGSTPALQRHLDYLLAHLRPSNRPQERVLNFSQFLMEQGPDFLHDITDRIQPFRLAHQLLKL
jgi:bacillithiol biosynthesis cysteine-adding enzyme BshC